MTTSRNGSDTGLRAFWRDLPRPGRILLSIVVIEFLGTGLVLPFQVSTCTRSAGSPWAMSGCCWGCRPLLGLLVVGPGGLMIDRLGARRVVLGILLLLMVSNVVLTFSETQWQAAIALGPPGHRVRTVVAGVPEPDRLRRCPPTCGSATSA